MVFDAVWGYADMWAGFMVVGWILVG